MFVVQQDYLQLHRLAGHLAQCSLQGADRAGVLQLPPLLVTLHADPHGIFSSLQDLGIGNQSRDVLRGGELDLPLRFLPEGAIRRRGAVLGTHTPHARLPFGRFSFFFALLNCLGRFGQFGVTRLFLCFVLPAPFTLGCRDKAVGGAVIIFDGFAQPGSRPFDLSRPFGK